MQERLLRMRLSPQGYHLKDESLTWLWLAVVHHHERRQLLYFKMVVPCRSKLN